MSLLTGVYKPPERPLHFHCDAEERERRLALVAEARSWIGTPYRLSAKVKGAGCDCATFALAVLQACGFASEEEIGQHMHDWFCHTQEEKYMRRMFKHAVLSIKAISYVSLSAQPGDVVLTRHDTSSKIFNHAGIVANWPMVIHSVHPVVEEIDATQHEMWCYREVCVFDLFERKT